MVVAKLRGITQAEIAEKLNISAAAVSAWAKEGRNPPSKHLSEIANILGVSGEFLLTGKGGPSDLNLESIHAENHPDEKVPSDQLPPQTEISRCLSIIESQQNTIETMSSTFATQTNSINNQSSALVTLSDSIATQSDTVASQHRLIETMVVGDKRGLG
jgi:transcriptional regulator with XRE-family HTH domain